MNFGVFGTKENCLIEKCLYYRGDCKEMFDWVHFLFCTFFIKKNDCLLKKKGNNAKTLSTFCCAMENIIA